MGNANGGLDCEMPGPAKSWGDNLVKEVNDGKVDEEIVNDKVRRILRVAEFTGRLDNPEEQPEKTRSARGELRPGLGFPIAAAAQILDSPLDTFSPARALCPTTKTADFYQHGPCTNF